MKALSRFMGLQRNNMRVVLLQPSLMSAYTPRPRMFSDTTDNLNASEEIGEIDLYNPTSFLDNFDQSSRKKKFKVEEEESDGEIGVEFESWNLQEIDPPEPDAHVQDVYQGYTPVGGEKQFKSQIPHTAEGSKDSLPKEVEMDRDEYNRATAYGIRKAAKADVYIKEGSGEHFVNGVPYYEYFLNFQDRLAFVKPFELLGNIGEFDVFATVKGGGTTGQSGAIRLGISKALQQFNPEFRRALRKGGMLTVDIRKVQRKMAGRKKARKMKQWVKR